MRYINQYTKSINFPTHKEKVIATSLSKEFDNFIKDMNTLEFEVAYIIPGYEHRPDLISDLFYGTVTNDWLIMMFNNVKDPFQELNVGDRVLIPKI